MASSNPPATLVGERSAWIFHRFILRMVICGAMAARYQSKEIALHHFSR